MATDVPVGTDIHLMNCTITLISPIGPDHSALNVTWLHNNQSISASDGTVETRDITAPTNAILSGLTLHQISQFDDGQYCCTASIAGNTTITSDCDYLHVTTTGEKFQKMFYNHKLLVTNFSRHHNNIRTVHQLKYW